jgi:hypothetical protein
MSYGHSQSLQRDQMSTTAFRLVLGVFVFGLFSHSADAAPITLSTATRLPASSSTAELHVIPAKAGIQ